SAGRTWFSHVHRLESLHSSAASTALALPIAWWTSRALSDTRWSGLTPLAMSTTPDGRVFGVTAMIAIATGLLVGVLPAWAAGKIGATAASQSPGRTTAASTRPSRVLVVAQVALSLMLLAGTALFARTLGNLRANQLRDDTHHAFFTRLYRDPVDRRPNDDPSYYPALVRRLMALPGI